MPSILVVHFNPEETKNKTLCGRVAADVTWRLHENGVTCKRCLAALAKGKA